MYELRLFKLLSAQARGMKRHLARVVTWGWQRQDIYGFFGIYVRNHLIITVTLVRGKHIAI